jgi:hypothetical protein
MAVARSPLLWQQATNGSGDMRAFWILVLSLTAALAGGAPVGAARNPYETQAGSTNEGGIDSRVFARLKELNVSPANLCSDGVFVRRVYLDAIGTLPTATEARDFLLDRRPDKRRALIERLLARDEFADYWAMKWSDLLRVKAEFPINLWPNAAQAYHRWIRTSLKENKSYDQFVRELLTASGSNFRVGQVNFYRALQNKDPQGIAQAVALTFMGARADKWPTNQLAGLAVFFSQVGYKSTAEWKEEIVFWDPGKTVKSEHSLPPPSAVALAAANRSDTLSPPGGEGWGEGHSWATFPDGARVKLTADRDPREVLADWLIDPKNPWFTRNIVNRVWYWLQGRAIIHEPDDIRSDNPPGNPELLTYLEQELIASHYDLKRLYRLILNSKTYQLASIPQSDKPEAEATFAFYPLRRLDAEVLIDALNQITSTTEKYSSPIPEPFTFIPEDQRSIALPDGSITSPFLEMFGRSPRDTGLESERNNRITADQRLHLLNSSHIQRKLEQSRMLRFQLQGDKPMREIVAALYLGILSRFPTESELQTAETYAQSAANRREAVLDLAWALINSAEFLYRH